MLDIRGYSPRDKIGATDEDGNVWNFWYPLVDYRYSEYEIVDPSWMGKTVYSLERKEFCLIISVDPTHNRVAVGRASNTPYIDVNDLRGMLDKYEWVDGDKRIPFGVMSDK